MMAAAYASTALNPLYLWAFRRIESHPTNASRLAHNRAVLGPKPDGQLLCGQTFEVHWRI